MKRKHAIALLFIPLTMCLYSCGNAAPIDEPTYLIIDVLPKKTTYEVGESFSLDGFVVSDSKTHKEVLDYTSSIEEGYEFKEVDVFPSVVVTISKESYVSASFNITVKEKGVEPPVTNRDLKIYYVNDTHGSFIRNEDNYEAGMSYISSYIKSRVALDEENAIVLSGGDMFQGGYESNETRGKIMIEAMNEIGFDAMVLGNHEFDWGESYIYDFAEELDCDIISSNTFYSSDNVTRPEWLSPYTIIERKDLKVGIIGGVEEGMGSSITGSISNNFYFPEVNEYVKEFSTYLRKEAGCDVIIGAFHDGGYEGSSGSPTKFSDLTQIDSETGRKYVDAMFFAHDHIAKRGSYNGVPYLEAGCNGKYIGEMTLSLLYSDDHYVVDDYSTYVPYAYSNTDTPDPAIEAIAQKAEYADIIAHADDVIYTFKHYYSRDNFTVVMCQAIYWFVNANKNLFDNTTVYFSCHNTGGVRATVDSGDFTRRDLEKVVPFDNKLSIQTCTPQNISNMEASSYYRTYKEGEPIYTDGLTKSVTIAYISEYEYAYYYQQSYVNYEYTAKYALVEYLISGVNPNL